MRDTNEVDRQPLSVAIQGALGRMLLNISTQILVHKYDRWVKTYRKSPDAIFL